MNPGNRIGDKAVDCLRVAVIELNTEEQRKREARYAEHAGEMRKLLYAWRKGLGTTEDLNRVTDRLLAKIEGEK